ncbi:N-methylhydantoinase A/oxoprolinase/acetone carboxylase, beta subunit [Methanosarcina thermophila]|jgi:N-methylhydantoinase A/oxoprolinase/acetone carboxylase beta subunit|uniref:Hydantoinase n=3 Tax=Methanosarcina thermophila TaxID=2210 RepID=A0A1I6X1E9_METTE|nr:hydantoinase/oxoprolinase family protein [Methanosarcina thermophila]ALK04795.1 MAG: hydantoinase [Methanosarcina sp. 795]AKB13506.1 Hydantoinase [Methanosarcina thermophila TM-1]AKB15859.1 Hydantoinase [Methanosarcina thermophila CHTI-55]NLU56582.1 hydantoinase/oxoprolinase family protein [Methanosarcina thermophila]SFT32123.1 N-methylhydantoinase A/oxoprolinase/acetone carboxylase, beta subunit [Methanosarcina thermophila]
MHFSLGIDAGGTYTDAVIVRDSDGSVIESSKALTTYPDPLPGMKNAIDMLNPEYLKDIKLVSVSTTLSTNTILEGTGFPVGLIMVGDYVIPEKLPTDYWVAVSGGHNSDGEELKALDIDSVKEFALRVKDKVSAFAVSSYFSNRNPEHELAVKKAVKELTGHPVVCGHELSQDLGAYERAVTAFLNAQLIPITHKFIQAIVKEFEVRGINANLLMLKCDGSVVGIEEALEKPIETIFSGPAASLVGASYLSKFDTCAMIDVGGTSTDVAMMVNGLPQLSNSGAVVGGWQTRVKAIRMETSATGGDSHVWVKGDRIYIGPRRVIPLCRASVIYPGFKDKLKRNKVAKGYLCESIQVTKFYVRTGFRPIELKAREREIYRHIGEEPVSFGDLLVALKKRPSPSVLDSLIQKRLIQAIGFTPTDALHVLGEYTEWDVEAAQIGASMLGRLLKQSPEAFSTETKRRVARNIAEDLIAYLIEGMPRSEIDRVLMGRNFTRFSVGIPVVLLGGPVKAYVEDLKNLINADFIVPEHAEVGNAVGALVGKGIKRVEILIKTKVIPISHEAEAENIDYEAHEKCPAEGIMQYETKNEFIVFSPSERKKFDVYSEAVEYAEKLGRQLVMDYMVNAGLQKENIRIDVSRRHLAPSGWTDAPLETNLVFVGIGTPKTSISA